MRESRPSKTTSAMGRWGALLIVGLGASEVLIMISPFAGFFYTGVRFEPLLGLLSLSPLTAWLDGFFLNHAAVTTSRVLEWQRTIGRYLFALGLWGFLISAGQVYGKKILRRGVATGLLYRFSRHPQYLCLGVAGWGLLTIWPRFLLLGLWVTMLFLYAGLARFEERRMAERFGEEYKRYARSRGAFLPGSPVRRLFEAGFGRLRPRPLGWATAYALCLMVAFALGGTLRAYTRSHTAILERPDARTIVISAWPQPEEWVSRVADAVLADPTVQERIDPSDDRPLVATILPARYIMKGMYYIEPDGNDARNRSGGLMRSLRRVSRLAVMFLLPIEGVTRPPDFMGIDPDAGSEPVEVVIARAEKPYKNGLALEEALDAGVRLTPLVVAQVAPAGGPVESVRIPLPRNRWGPRVVMPLF
ncbi:MAG: methyltransferase family protein [Acidobacteriota bacterium]